MATQMSALMDLVCQAQPSFQTYQALLVIGLQNDFIQPDGRLPVDITTGFLDRIQTLIPRFRRLNGKVIWVKTVYEADRIANDANIGEGDPVTVGNLVEDEASIEGVEQSRGAKHKQRALDLLKRVGARKKTAPAPRTVVEEDEESFLLKSATRAPACMPGTPGAEFAGVTNSLKEPLDSIIKTSNYSAFQGTSLLVTLRARLVTELYICGCITNVSVLATVIDGARHGIKINIVEDCLGWRKFARHELALKRMTDFFDAWIIKSEDILAREETVEGNGNTEKELEALVNKLSLNDQSQVVAEKAAPDEEPSDEQFADALMRGAKSTRADREGEKEEKRGETTMVKTKIRMRSKAKRKAKKAAGESKNEVAVPAKIQPTDEQGSNSSAPAETTQPITSIAITESAPTLQGPEESSLQPPVLSVVKEEDLPLSRESTEASSSTETNDPEKTTTASKIEETQKTQPSTLSNDLSSITRKKESGESDHSQTPSMSTNTPKMGKSSKLQSLANFLALGPGDCIAEGDSRIVHDFFPTNFRHPTDPSEPLRDLIFAQLYNEVRWQKMLHQQGEVPRLVCCQGEFSEDGSMPVYRHPSDQSLPLLHFSPKVQVIRKQAEKLVGHPLNHVLIQLYRSGNDFISEHSDKTLDIVKDSSIVNVSFGAQRTMRLRTKKSANDTEERTTQRVHLPHNSLFVLGLASNAKWLHGIMADKRLPAERSSPELDYNGMRISLTFRHIGTFLDAKESIIWGQGATAKSQSDAADVINSDEKEAERMIRAFSHENHSSDFNWEEHYGAGFDILHLHTPPADLPILFASKTGIETKQVQLALWECKIPHTLMDAPVLDHAFEHAQPREITFRDNDTHHTEVSLVQPVLLYLDRYHPLDRSDSRACTAAAHPVIALASTLLEKYQRWIEGEAEGFVNALAVLEERVQMHGGPFIAGKRFSIADCFVWPVVDELVGWAGWSRESYPALSEYYVGTWRKKASVKKLRDVLGDIVEKTGSGEERVEG
ncbi:hypothetical protein P153DRAFT_288326 [Dothidotthia symphoricarpi CBS 119687]|uniref:Fe2OG dioxygenase domain-containing protein n=1 Tax=Dothidotthia symphoricarpi CBS 119687 TaxID=1392245 RepID=A0A6A6AIR5_9PLEO|nr:uncharacterized protein P153DRAFT_288326 [Dothidotthia symphoricarpi CBS 119687]KAF2130321.1 hypothetical protein P153DRAFT_288326 [Dothidotthia symphoricarpi CBS 119687]